MKFVGGASEYGIPRRYLNRILSPWAVKRLDEFGGDIRKFKVVKRYPSVLKQIGIAKTEPGDENNQDISALVGKVDIRKLETYAQDDPDIYILSNLNNIGSVEVTRTGAESFLAQVMTLVSEAQQIVEGVFAKNIFAHDDEDIEAVIVRELTARKQTADVVHLHSAPSADAVRSIAMTPPGASKRSARRWISL